MIARISLICLFSLHGILCVAQQKKIDSLQLVLKSQTGADTFRLNTLLALVRASAGIDFNGGISAADEAIELATKLGYPSKLGLAHMNKGVLYHGKSEFEKFIAELELALPNYEKARDLPGQGRTLWAMNIGYSALGDYHKANQLAERSIEIYQQTGEIDKQANSFNSLGINHFELGNYPKALEFYLAALRIYEEKNDPHNIAIATSNIGMVNKYLTRYSKALEYYEKGLAIYEKLGQNAEVAKNLNKIGTVYDDSGNSRKAIEYYQRSFAINKKNNYSRGLASDYSNMGISYIDLHEYDSAISNLKQGLALIEELNDRSNRAGVLTYLGIAIARAPDSILVKYNISPARKLVLAEKYLREGLEIQMEIESLKGQFAGLEGLAEIYKKQNNFRGALEVTEKLSVIKDSLFNAKKSMAIARSEMQFEQDKKDAVVQAEHLAEIRQQKNKRNSLLAGAAIILVASGLLFFSYKRRRDAIDKKNAAELKAHVAETDLKVMRLQMNPHFIFNSLNSIGDYIAKNNSQEADDYLTKFAKVMRMTLENSEQQAISLRDDLKALDLYMQLEAKRLNNKFTYEIRIADDIDQENTLVPPMIFQPFVENSIWHGISKKEGKGHIIIDVRKENEMLSCRIDDDGIGRKQALSMQQDKKLSLGMKITKARIELLNKLKGSGATVELIDKPQGLTAALKLPVESNF